MRVIKYIKEHGIDKLKTEYGIDVNDYDNYFVLNYNQINSPKHNPMVDECRSLILDRHTLEPLARGFDRFYNYGEDQNSADFDFSKCVVQEKVDGSLILVWWNPYNMGWEFSTRKMAHAEGSTAFGGTYMDLFMKTVKADGFNELCHEFTYIFELATPENRVVTPYSTYSSVLLAVRDPATGKYIPSVDREIDALGVSRPLELKALSIAHVKDLVSGLHAMDEGFVCYWPKKAWRIKVKNPSYLAIAHLRNNGQLSHGRVARLVLSNDEEEYLQYFPDDRRVFQDYIDARDRLHSELLEHWKRLCSVESQKDFALEIKDKPYAGILFNMRKGVSMSDALLGLNNAAKERLMEAML